MSRAGRGTPPRGGRGRNPRWWVVAAAVAAVLVAVIALQVADGDDDRDGVEADAAGIAHVHGLGVNPADDDLYIATHHGVFRIGPGGKATKVGSGYQDTMGFTVMGPDRFLASGHPDLAAVRAGKPPRLGLIGSTDAGETWRSLSLEGEADFHALVAAHGLIYGYDSTGGRFMVSPGGESWTTRSTVPLADFAVDPANADHIVAAGAVGLLESVDGGRNWSPLPAPLLAVVSWDHQAGLFGAQPDGAVHRSLDGGKVWEQSGRLDGRPEALLARPDVLFAAAVGDDGRTGIYRSKDEGRTWSLFYRDPA